MARTAPVPNIPAIPGMAPGAWVMGGGGGGGGGSGKGGSGAGGEQGADGEGGGDGAAGGDGTAPSDVCTQEGEPVDVATGSVMHDISEFELTGIFKFVWRVSYQSSARRLNVARLGFGWTHSYSHRLHVHRRNLVMIDDGGVQHEFPLVERGASSVKAFGLGLTHNDDGSYTYFTRSDGLWRDLVPATATRGAFLLARVRDVTGNAVQVHYDDQDRITHFIDTVGRTIRVRYGAYDCIQSLEVNHPTNQGATLRVVSYEFDSNQNLISATDAMGYRRTYEWDEHLLRSWTNRIGFTVHYRYSGSGVSARCTETWGEHSDGSDPAISAGLVAHLNTPSGGTCVARGVHHRLLAYEDNVTEAYDTRGGCTRYVVNNLGVVDKFVTPSGIVITQRFDNNGNRTSLVDEIEASWHWDFDDQGRVLRHTDALGRVREYRYGEHWLPVELEAPNGGVWRFVHDEYGRRVQTHGPLGRVIDYVLDERGGLAQIRHDGQSVYTAKRDWHGQVTSLVDRRGETRFLYDFWGRVVGIVTKDGQHTRMAYNNRGDLVSRTDADGATTRFEYDGEGNMVTVFAPDGSVRRAKYNGAGWLYEVTDARGQTRVLRYDYEGEIVQAVNERQEAYEFEYDLEGRVVAVHGIDGRVVRHAYDAASRCVRTTHPNGEVSAYEYDAYGNLLQVEYGDGAIDEYAYDDLNFVVVATNEHAKVDFTRDLYGRVVTEKCELRDQRFEVMSDYHRQGFRVSRAAADTKVSFERNEAMQPVARVFDSARRQDLTHDVMGRLIGFRYANGLEASFSYDEIGRLVEQTYTRPRGRVKVDEYLTELEGTDEVVARRFEYSSGRELACVTDRVENTSIRYTYGSFGELTECVSPTLVEKFWHDPTGNVAHDGQSMTRERGDRVVQLGNVELAYDDKGRVVRKTRRGQNEEVWRLRWGSADQLLAVQMPDGRSVQFEYDAMGRRTRKTLSDGACVYYFWDANSLAHELRVTAEGAETARTYVFEEQDPFRPVAHKEAGKWFDYVTTPIGSPTELIDDSGEVAWLGTSAAYGVLRHETSNESDTAIRFPGQYADVETGFHYNRFRYYDPEIGRYLSADPIGVDGGLNEYAYARNPIGWIDPLGWANGAALNNSMVAAGQAGAPSGFATHHIIPETLYNDPQYSSLLGADPPGPHASGNGIQLPSSQAAYEAHAASGNPPQPAAQTIHRGGHSGYTKHVRQQLDDIKTLPACQRPPALARLRAGLNSDMQNGSHTHTNSRGQTVNGLNRHGNVTTP